MDETSPPSAEETKGSGSVGPLFATIIIVVVFLLGGAYFFVRHEQRVHELQKQNEATQLPTNS